MPADAPVVLLHSPLVGPATMRPLADALTRLGCVAVVPDLRLACGEPPHLLGWIAGADVAIAALDATPVVVGHSGAGPLLPLLRVSSALVFMDAGLPGVAASSGTVERIAALEDPVTHLVPPWLEWWPEDVVEGLVGGDRAIRDALVADGPPILRSLLEDTPPAPPDGWDVQQAAYIRLGRNYEVFCAEAEQRGWPVRRFDGWHLHHMVAPDAVAAAIVDLTAA